MITQGEITGAAHPPRDTWIATATGFIPAPLSFFHARSTPVFSTLRTPGVFFFFCNCLGYLRVALYKCRTEYNCYDRETSGQDPSYHEQFNKHDP